VLAAAALSVAAAPAQAADPATDFAPDSAPVVAAQEISKSYWQATPCAGQVSITWMALGEGTNATSTWANPVGQYDAPQLNSDCQIAFNSALAWDWTRFCSVLVHEYGHLNGKPHSSDSADLMYPYYEKPVEQCVAAAPTQPAVVPEIVQPSAVLPALKNAAVAVSSSRRVKRGVIVVVHEPRKQAKRHTHKPHRLTRAQRKHRTARRQQAKRQQRVLRKLRAAHKSQTIKRTRG
jgi:hypothetical protein